MKGKCGSMKEYGLLSRNDIFKFNSEFSSIDRIKITLIEKAKICELEDSSFIHIYKDALIYV